MVAIWESYLRGKGAVLQEGRVLPFQSLPQEAELVAGTATLSDWSHFGLLRFQGEEARTFLQGQLTSDLREVDATKAQRSGYCSPKGRLLASFLLSGQDDGFDMLLPAALVAPVQKRLSMFILRSKVKAQDVSDGSVRLRVQGPGAAAALTAAGLPAPAAALGVARAAGVRVIRDGDAAFLLILPPEEATAVAEKLAAGLPWVGADAAALTDIRAGIPWILPATVEEFVPQMVNFEEIGAVSFKKGCYPGQEIVARSQYLGQTKRKMHRFGCAREDVQPGDGLYAAGSANASGTVVNVAPAPGGGIELLAVVHRDTIAQGAPCLNDGTVLSPLPLPYSAGT